MVVEIYFLGCVSLVLGGICLVQHIKLCVMRQRLGTMDGLIKSQSRTIAGKNNLISRVHQPRDDKGQFIKMNTTDDERV